MNSLTLETQSRLIGGLVFLLAGYVVWLGQLKIDGLPGEYDNPVLALELVEKGADIDAINRAETKVKDKKVTANEFISKQLRKDSGFIVLYVVLFSILALFLARLISPPWKSVAFTSIACAFVAGILDFVENHGMRKALALIEGGASDQLAKMVRYPSLAKWGLSFIFCILVGLVFLCASHAKGVNTVAVGVLLLLGGLVGLSGVIANICKAQFYVMFPAGLAIQAFGFIWMAIAFLGCPKSMISGFRN